MRKAITFGCVVLVLTCTGAALVARERAVNAYRTHKLNTTSVLISCEDEREPVVKKLDNTTMIVVTCEVR